MVDYEFKCPKCNKCTYTHSTSADYPDRGDKLVCLECKKEFEIEDCVLRCEVKE